MREEEAAANDSCTRANAPRALVLTPTAELAAQASPLPPLACTEDATAEEAGGPGLLQNWWQPARHASDAGGGCGRCWWSAGRWRAAFPSAPSPSQVPLGPPRSWLRCTHGSPARGLRCMRAGRPLAPAHATLPPTPPLRDCEAAEPRGAAPPQAASGCARSATRGMKGWTWWWPRPGAWQSTLRAAACAWSSAGRSCWTRWTFYWGTPSPLRSRRGNPLPLFLAVGCSGLCVTGLPHVRPSSHSSSAAAPWQSGLGKLCVRAACAA